MDNQNQDVVSHEMRQQSEETTEAINNNVVEEKNEQITSEEKETNATQETQPKAEETQLKEDFSAEILSADSDENLENQEETIEELTTHYSKMSREELVEEIKSLSNSENIEQMKMRSNLVRNAFRNLTSEYRKEVKDKFLKDGGLEEDFKLEDDNLDIEFNKFYSLYREKRQKYLDEQEKIKQENVVKKNETLEELRLLLDSEESLKEIYDKFNLIQEKWKSIGQVPRSEVNGLWQNYHFLIEKFYDKVKINRELRNLDLKRNLDAKIELCERAEGLIFEPSLNVSFKALQEIHQQWKEIGAVPMDKNDEIWERFKNASDQINKRRQEYYEKMRTQLENNLLAKEALCEKAEAVVQRNHDKIVQWNESSDEMNEMLKLWKTIGPVPQKDNESIWNRFKSSLDTFFETKKIVFDKLKQEQDVNYNKKIEICLKAEAISERNDWKKATAELIQLQNDWKEIGYLPKKLSDKVWTRFRAACDKFFERKSEFYKSNRESETENLAKKEALIKAVKEFEFGEDKEENLNHIKDFQRQWSEIGYVPSGEKDRLQKEFRSAINSHFEKLQIDAQELKLNSFKERISNVEDNKSVSREKKFLLDKIQKLKDEINLWENNLGFLANSKQADILKAEFEKKMESTRKEIALEEAKLKMLEETLKSQKQ